MNIELSKLSEIKPYPGNPRHNDEAVDAVAASIREFGFRQPIVVDAQGVIICGHTRYKAAVKLGLEKVPVHVATDLTPAQIKAYRIADNQTASLAEWNYDLLPIELGELAGMNYDLGLLGFSDDELAKLLDPGVKDGLCDPDEVPAPPDEAITRPGDLWLLGDHRLLCGDAGKPEDVDRLLDGAPIHLVNTDPPYNVKVEPRSNNAIAAGITSFSRREDLQCEWSQSERGKRDRARLARKAAATHHQGFDLARHPEKGQATHRKLRATLKAVPPAAASTLPSPTGRGQGEGSPRRGVQPALARLVWQPGPRARAGAGILHLGRVYQLCQPPAGAEGLRTVLLAGNHLGEGASGAHAEGQEG